MTEPRDLRAPPDPPDPPEPRDPVVQQGGDEPTWVLEDGSPVHIEPVRRPSIWRRVLLGIVALAVVVVMALGVALRGPAPEGPSSTLPPDPRIAQARIAVVAPDGTLAIVARTGDLVRRFPVEATALLFPAFSPDGTRLAVIGGAAGRSGVLVFDVGPDAGSTDEAIPQAVYSSEDRAVIYFSWAPDGERIGLLTGEPGTLALRVVDADGLGVESIVLRGQPLYWDWQDGERLLVHSSGTGPEAFIGYVDIDGATSRATEVPPGIFQAPAISHGADYRAFVGELTNGESAIVVERSDGIGQATFPVVRAASLAWSPVADDIAYIDGGGAAGPAFGPLRVGSAASGATTTLLDAEVAAFFWSPDGRSIAALTVSPKDGGNVASAASPVGDTAVIPGIDVRLIIVRADTGERVVERIVRLSDIFEQQLLPFFDQYAKSHRIWSAGSDAIVLPLVDVEGGSHLTVIHADGRTDVDLGPGVLGFWSP